MTRSTTIPHQDAMAALSELVRDIKTNEDSRKQFVKKFMKVERHAKAVFFDELFKADEASANDCFSALEPKVQIRILRQLWRMKARTSHFKIHVELFLSLTVAKQVELFSLMINSVLFSEGSELASSIMNQLTWDNQTSILKMCHADPGLTQRLFNLLESDNKADLLDHLTKSKIIDNARLRNKLFLGIGHTNEHSGITFEQYKLIRSGTADIETRERLFLCLSGEFMVSFVSDLEGAGKNIGEFFNKLSKDFLPYCISKVDEHDKVDARKLFAKLDISNRRHILERLLSADNPQSWTPKELLKDDDIINGDNNAKEASKGVRCQNKKAVELFLSLEFDIQCSDLDGLYSNCPAAFKSLMQNMELKELRVLVANPEN